MVPVPGMDGANAEMPPIPAPGKRGACPPSVLRSQHHNLASVGGHFFLSCFVRFYVLLLSASLAALTDASSTVHWAPTGGKSLVSSVALSWCIRLPTV